MLVIIGYLTAEDELYKIKRQNIVVLPQKSTKPADEKEVGETMRKNCYRRTDGRWQYAKRINGMQYYAIANTYRELLEKIKNIEPRKVRNVQKIKKGRVLTFIQFFEHYIESFVKTKNLKPGSLAIWYNVLDHYIKPNFQRIDITKLTVDQLQKFVSGIAYERTREIVYQKTVKVLQKAYIIGQIKRDITLGLEKPKRQNVQERSPLTLDEQVAFLERIKGTKIYAFAMFSLIVGSRREETIQFDLNADVDFEKCTIHIRGTKTKNADRKVIVTPAFLELLKNNLPKGRFKFSKDYPTKIIGDIFRELGIGNCLHGLRHTCAANLYFLGANDKYRQMQLGHASIVTTNDIYTNIKENIPKAALRQLYGDLYPNFD